MTTFDDRERAFESLFAYDEELRFLALVRRNQLIARWAAEMIGLRGTEYHTYVRSFVTGAVQGEGKEVLFRRIRSDFVSCGIDTSEEGVRTAMTMAEVEAAREVRTQTRRETMAEHRL